MDHYFIIHRFLKDISNDKLIMVQVCVTTKRETKHAASDKFNLLGFAQILLLGLKRNSNRSRYALYHEVW